MCVQYICIDARARLLNGLLSRAAPVWKCWKNIITLYGGVFAMKLSFRTSGCTQNNDIVG